MTNKCFIDKNIIDSISKEYQEKMVSVQNAIALKRSEMKEIEKELKSIEDAKLLLQGAIQDLNVIIENLQEEAKTE